MTSSANENIYSWKEVKSHSSEHDCWVVVNDCVYDLTNFKQIHPGGNKIIQDFAGQDASVF